MKKHTLLKLLIAVSTIDNFVAALIMPVFASVVFPIMKDGYATYNLVSVICSMVAAEMVGKQFIIKWATKHFNSLGFITLIFTIVVLVIGIFSPILMMFSMVIILTIPSTLFGAVISRVTNLYIAGDELTFFTNASNKWAMRVSVGGAALATAFIKIPNAFVIAILVNVGLLLVTFTAEWYLRNKMLHEVADKL